MQDFLTFTSSLFSDLSAFLLSEPIIWFVGIFLLVAIAGLFIKLIHFN